MVLSMACGDLSFLSFLKRSDAPAPNFFTNSTVDFKAALTLAGSSFFVCSFGCSLTFSTSLDSPPLDISAPET